MQKQNLFPWFFTEGEIIPKPSFSRCRPVCCSGSVNWWRWRELRRCWAAAKSPRRPGQPRFGGRRVELPEAGLPDHWLRKPGGPAAHRGKELGHASVERPDPLGQLGHLKHGPPEQHWALPGTFNDYLLSIYYSQLFVLKQGIYWMCFDGKRLSVIIFVFLENWEGSSMQSQRNP